MLRSLLLSVFVLCLWVLPARAAVITVAQDLIVEIDLREGWSLHIEPVAALVKELAAHVAHEPSAAGATPEQIERVVRKRLSANEATIYHAASGAHLDLDFSPSGQGEAAPGPKVLRNSAEFAAQSLIGEEDVTDVVWEVSQVRVDGSREAFKLAADYQQHDLPVRFVGLIGYVEGSWFFLYYTDPSQDSGIFAEMQQMLDGLVIRRLKN